MYVWMIAALALIAIYFMGRSYTRKVKARIARIKRVQGPHAQICYMNVRGKRYRWKISIESAKPVGQDWQITAWCHEKNEFLILYASRMHEYFDLKENEEIKSVPSHFTQRFGRAHSQNARAA